MPVLTHVHALLIISNSFQFSVSLLLKMTGISRSCHVIRLLSYNYVCFRTFQVVRVNGKFGFVIKGSNPAFIETIDAEGPADRAGLQIGDFITKLNGIDVR